MQASDVVNSTGVDMRWAGREEMEAWPTVGPETTGLFFFGIQLALQFGKDGETATARRCARYVLHLIGGVDRIDAWEEWVLQQPTVGADDGHAETTDATNSKDVSWKVHGLLKVMKIALSLSPLDADRVLALSLIHISEPTRPY